MALSSPGVQVTITDQSQYLPAPTNSVPLILVATAQNKADASGTSTAQATLKSTANKLYLVTSQRDLVNLYGKPFFYNTTNGTPINGYELNEYGLMAAYSTLGVTNRAYVLRADVDLASLVGKTSRPTGAPADGTYWLDTASSTWGINEFNATTGQFVTQTPIVIDDIALLDGAVPSTSIGTIGNYAVVAIPTYDSPSDTHKTFFYKNSKNEWVTVGSPEWKNSIPAVRGSKTPITLNTGDTFTINVGGRFTKTVTVSTTPANTLADIAGQITGWNLTEVSAEVRSGKLVIFSNQNNLAPGAVAGLTIAAGTGTVLTDIGITAGTYNQPRMSYGTSAQMPLWARSQASPRPSGSVWIKVGAQGTGLSPALYQYNGTTRSWAATKVTQHPSDWASTFSLDSTGGKNIPAGTVYAEYGYNSQVPNTPYYLWERVASGETTVTGSVANPVFNSTTCDDTGPYTLLVRVSIPGSAALTAPYTVTIPDSSDSTDFVTAFLTAGIPYVTAQVINDDATQSIQLSHTLGGVISLDDSTAGKSNGVISAAGFAAGSTVGSKKSYAKFNIFNAVEQTTTTGTGQDATFNIQQYIDVYAFAGNGIAVGGTGYNVDDLITIDGATLGGQTTINDLTLTVTSVIAGVITGVSIHQIPNGNKANTDYTTILSNWVPFEYTPNLGAPSIAPANNTNWFYSVVDQVDIMVQKGGNWVGYRNTNYDTNGHPSVTGTNVTDPNGPIIGTSEPSTQSDGTALEYGDLWINTSDLENYPVISRWQQVNGVNQWTLIDNTDQTSQAGITFMDARWATNGSTSPVDDSLSTIKSLLTSNYLDLDAPSATLYPQGTLLFNTRRSGYNVKQYKVNYFNGTDFTGQTLPQYTGTWVTVSGNAENGTAYMGRKAQRAMVVKAMRSAIDTNTSIRDEDNYFNLIAAPGYPELQPNMVVLNSDKDETAYIIGDTPMGLSDDATKIQSWANNDSGAASTGEDGLVTRNTYLGIFYPSGITNDLSGNQVVVPASHMMLRTFIRNDTIAYPWLAAAGTRRGTIDNALNIGYINRSTGEFQVIKTRIGIRDTLYTNQINPMVFFTGVGLLNYGNKSSFNSQSALDRTNVARLVNYIRRQLTLATRPFVFEPNDALTRNQVAGVIQTLMVDLVAKRGLYDYLVVCDSSNNTSARIDRSELWIDVAIEPVKAAEFIYIPVRVLNTGELSATK